MSHTNYNAMTRQSVRNVDDLNVNQDQKQQVVNVHVVPEVEPAIDETKIEVGVVANCNRLNVRKSPDAQADVVCIIDNGTEVYVDMDTSTEDFYKVQGESDFEGYCMKKYIAIQQ